MAIMAIAGTVNISPIEECVMGCGDFQEPTKVCRDTLEANFVILTESDKKVLIISLDLLYVGERLRREITKSLSSIFANDEVFLAASHTHYAPMVDDSKNMMGAVNDTYLDRIVGELHAAIIKALTNNPIEIEIKHGEYSLSQVVSRRRRRLLGVKNKGFHFNKVVMLPNPSMREFPKAHIIVLEREGTPLAVFWQFSCHPTSLPSGTGHSAHYIGEVRKKLRREIQLDVPFIFFQGLSGDLRPPAFDSNPSRPKKILEKWIVGSRFRLFTENEYEIWCDSIYRDFFLNFMKLSKIQTSKIENRVESLKLSRQTWPLDDFFQPKSIPDRIFSIQKIEIDQIVMIGASAELISNWDHQITAMDASKEIITISCIDDAFGYLPDYKTMNEGGYEAGEYCELFHLPPLSINTEKIFLEKLRSFFPT